MPLRYRATICKINHYFSHSCDNECEFCQKKPLPSPHNPDNPFTPRVLPRPSPVRVSPSPQRDDCSVYSDAIAVPLLSRNRCPAPAAMPPLLSRGRRLCRRHPRPSSSLESFPRPRPPSPQGGRLSSIQRCHRCPPAVPQPLSRPRRNAALLSRGRRLCRRHRLLPCPRPPPVFSVFSVISVFQPVSLHNALACSSLFSVGGIKKRPPVMDGDGQQFG